VYGSVLLAMACVAWLLFFINHISRSVSVNHIIHKIARDTEDMIEQTMPHKQSTIKYQSYKEVEAMPGETVVVSTVSGYVRSINAQRLFYLAVNNKITINVLRHVGHFVPVGVPLLKVNDPNKLSSELEKNLRNSFVIGPTRTLEQDIEFGILQIVDIALKALSPAVNDPSTAITCIDQLSSILINYSAREIPKTMFYQGSDKLRVTIPWLGFERLLDSAFEQIRIYARNDMAASLRLLRAFSDIAVTVQDMDSRRLLLQHAQRLIDEFSEKLGENVLKEMKHRVSIMKRLTE
jgi:uncharacterized membrane protein